ncbi:MAG: GtrA family protein [Mesorhizobium sp.]|nr:GtrA family protein [Mesorhizobium sp. M1D.F.Ca.ET.043.01.1.1]RWA96046.1 MAG: GtrA family protein [Mesorhizobium sp.]RWE05849.1 MAG: GtrA family protein [Mesorhizobium sp.]TJW82624.1 MAG: GtrA family protein [Mesorhizobium sp.]
MPSPAMNSGEQVEQERHTVAPERPLLERGWRYMLVGLVCAITHNAVMIGVDRAGGHYLLGTVVSFMVVSPLGYTLHSRFTFAEPFRLKAFARFAGSMAAAYPISTAMMVVLCSGLGLDVAVATPIATVALFVWNFVAAHWAILPQFYLRRAPVATAPSRPAKQHSIGNGE